MAEEETPERGNWTGKLDFLLSAIGYAVGLGNVWRFPYLAYKNGGASFLFPYIIMLVIAGLPLFFIELAIGQFTSQGPITCWQMAPFFCGIGYAMVVCSAVVSIYYNMIIAYAIYYMLVSFVSLDEGLPWEKCGHTWNTPSCLQNALERISDYSNNITEQWNILYANHYNEGCVARKVDMTQWSDYNSTTGRSEDYQVFLANFMKQMYNSSLTIETLTPTIVDEYDGFNPCAMTYTTPSEEYYTNNVLNEENIDNLAYIGGISLKLVFTLFVAWLLIFACLMKGIKTSGKVVYFTATFPYLVLIVLLVRGVTLEGHQEGVKFYVIPEWGKLLDATIWSQAASQIFYSLGIAFGGLLTMASYNKFNNNCYRDAILVACINCGTSIFAGFAIFSLLGHMAFVTNKEVKDVATSGAGLAFVAYPDGISRLPASPIWAFLFFFMILTLGMDSQFAMMETIISAITDLFPKVLRKWKTPFTFMVCMIGFLLGIPLCTEGGGRVLDLMNNYSGSYNLMIVAIAELVCICYVYGINNFRQDVEMMVGIKPGLYWIITWCAITPLTIVFIVIVSAIQYAPSAYNDIPILGFAEALGWLMVAAPLVALVVPAVVQACRLGFMNSLRPQSDWGPANPENRTGRYATSYSMQSMQLETGKDGAMLHSYTVSQDEKKNGFDNLALESEGQ